MNTPRTGAIIELISRAVNQTDRAQFLALCMDAERGIAELERELAALREQLAERDAEIVALKGRLHEIAEEWAGAECGEPVTAQEGYAIGLCKRMYRLAAYPKE